MMKFKSFSRIPIRTKILLITMLVSIGVLTLTSALFDGCGANQDNYHQPTRFLEGDGMDLVIAIQYRLPAGFVVFRC
jgi:hypothetical protein